MNVLVIGCAGTGKSLLLKKLSSWNKSKISRKSEEGLGLGRTHVDLNGSIEENPAAALYEDNTEVPATKPTIGTNVSNVKLPKIHQDVVLKEIGGLMAPLWKSSYKDAKQLIFIIDISNPSQVSATTSFLHEIIVEETLKNTPILLVLNKIDNYCPMSLFEMKYLIGLEDILQARGEITVLETSIKYETGISNIIEWLSAN